MSDITPEDARGYVDRWSAANAAELDELRRTSMDTKLRQLTALVASRTWIVEDSARENEVDVVRRRWAQLKQVLGA
jgi:hypothetical protein